MINTLIYFDTRLFLLFNRDIANPIFDFIFPLITLPKFWILPALAALSLLILKQKKRALIMIGASLALVALSDPLTVRVIKPLVGRLRPNNPEHWVAGGRFLFGNSLSYAFPSAHAVNSFAQAALFTGFFKGLWPLFFLSAGAIGFSRIYVGVHFPLDVAAGALLGTLLGLCAYLTVRKLEGIPRHAR